MKVRIQDQEIDMEDLTEQYNECEGCGMPIGRREQLCAECFLEKAATEGEA